MVTIETLTEVIKRIEKLATEKAFSDNDHFCPVDCGNYDDTFSQGKEDGKIFLARDLLAILTKD